MIQVTIPGVGLMEIHSLVLDFNGTVATDGKLIEGVANEYIDEMMLSRAVLSIAVIGVEGCSTKALINSDITTNHINDALDLLLNLNRLIPTLRI